MTYSVVWGPQWGFAPPDNIHHAAPQCPTLPHKPTTSPIWDISDFGYFNSLHKKIAGRFKSLSRTGIARYANGKTEKMKIGLRWLGLVIKDNCSDSESTL